MTALWQLSATEWRDRLARGEVSARESVDAQIERIEAVNPAINALVVSCFDQARAEADAADAKRARGETLGPLHGLPVSIKECLALQGTAATGGLTTRKALIDTVDDPHVARLRAAGGIVLGKTNVPQLMSFVETENPLYGLTRNPWHHDRACGGSTGGEGALIAAGGSPLGLGTDIGGSIRVPAAFCGIFGLKPGSGRANDACGIGFSKASAPSFPRPVYWRAAAPMSSSAPASCSASSMRTAPARRTRRSPLHATSTALPCASP